MSEVIKRRFSAYPQIKTVEEENALQAINLQPKYSFGKIPYSVENDSITAEYYFYVNNKDVEFLVCEVSVKSDALGNCSLKGVRAFTEKIYELGMYIEEKYKILPEFVREDKNEFYYIRMLSILIGRWLTSLGVMKLKQQ